MWDIENMGRLGRGLWGGIAEGAYALGRASLHLAPLSPKCNTLSETGS